MPKTKANGRHVETRDLGARIAELERGLRELELRLAMLEARRSQPLRKTRILSETGVTEPILLGTQSEPDHVHDVEKPT